MPGYWRRLVDSLPRDSKSLVWRAPLVAVTCAFFLLVFFPFQDTPYAIEVVHDTYVEGKIDPARRQVISRQLTNIPIWLTNVFHYRGERELATKELPPQAGYKVRERTIEVRSRGLSLGLDLSGGTELLYRIIHVGTGEATRADEIKRVIEKRINLYGLREPRIQAQGTYRILVQLPGQEAGEMERLKAIIQNIGHLEFRLVANQKSEAYKEWKDTGAPPSGFTVYTIKVHSGEERTETEEILVSDANQMTGREIANTRVISPGAGGSLRGYSVGLSFSPKGEQEFARLTGENVGERLAIILNTGRDAEDNILKGQIGVCDSAPVIRTRIFGDAVIEGDFTDKTASDLRTVLMAGSLPAPLELEHETSVGPGLGSALITKGIRASVVGTILVIVFMAVYYLVAGLIADLAVVLNVLILVSIMTLFSATLTLPGIAGLALTVGMAVDANVLIFERIREELSGPTEKPLRLAVREGFNRAFLTIFDCNLTTVLTALILYWIGTGPVKGFGLTLTIGLIVNIFTAVVVTRVIFDILTWRRWLTKLPMLQLFKRPNIRFMRLRYKCFTGSAILIIVGMAVFLWRWNENLDIDFRGGTLLHVAFREPQNAEDLARRLHAAGEEFAGAEVQSLAASEQGVGFAHRLSREFEVRIPSISEVTVRSIATDPNIEPGSLIATLTLREAMKPEDLALKLEPYNYAVSPVEGKPKTFRIEAPILDLKQIRAEIQKALEPDKKPSDRTSVADLELVNARPNFPTLAEVTSDRELPINDIQEELAADGTFWKVKAAESAEARGKFVYSIHSSVRETAAARTQIERAFAKLSLSAEVLDLFKDDLAPSGIEPRRERGKSVTLAVTVTRHVGLDKLEKKLEAWKIDADARLDPEVPPESPFECFLITLPKTKVAELTNRLTEDSDTFRLSEPIPRVAKVGPAVAKELVIWAIVGVVASWLAIIAYVWLRFERIQFGIGGVVALIHDVLITLGFLAIFGRKINLPIVAAILTLIGYSINDTIVVFDRIRENLRKERKRDVDADIIDRSVNQTLSRTTLTSLTTLFAVLALFLFAGGVIQDFALTLLIGITTGTYSSIFIASPILILHQQKVEKRFGRAQAAAATSS